MKNEKIILKKMQYLMQQLHSFHSVMTANIFSKTKVTTIIRKARRKMGNIIKDKSTKIINIERINTTLVKKIPLTS